MSTSVYVTNMTACFKVYGLDTIGNGVSKSSTQQKHGYEPSRKTHKACVDMDKLYFPSVTTNEPLKAKQHLNLPKLSFVKRSAFFPCLESRSETRLRRLLTLLL